MDPDQAEAEARALDLVTCRLERRFADVPPETIRAEVDRVRRGYEHSRVRGFVAILVEREVAESLVRRSVNS